MAEWVANQIVIPNEQVHFKEYEPEDEVPVVQWSNNLLEIIHGGFVKSLEIYGMPGSKLYLGPTLEDEDLFQVTNSLILGPGGVFKINLEDEFLISDIRIAKESYDTIKENSSYLAFNIVSSYAPWSSSNRIVIFNGGGVNVAYE